MIEYRIEQLATAGPKTSDSAWVWVASRLGEDSEALRAEVEQARVELSSRALRRHRVRRVEPGAPEWGKTSAAPAARHTP